MNYYSEQQVKELLKQQRDNCARICYGRIRMGDINREQFYDAIKNATEPTMPESSNCDVMYLDHTTDTNESMLIEYGNKVVTIEFKHGEIKVTENEKEV